MAVLRDDGGRPSERTRSVSELRALFEPRSVAVYGASRDTSKLGHTLLQNTVNSYDGEVIPVNAAGGEILGLTAVEALQRPADLALISVPAPAAPAAVEDAARAGCRSAIVLTGGFGETGADGLAAERRMRDTARTAGMRLVGPNCMGIVSRGEDETWLNGSYFWSMTIPAGPVGFVSQSGGFGGMFLAEAARRGLGLSRFLSVGNCADVSEVDVLEFLGQDQRTGVIALFCEAIDDGRRFVDVARSISPHKPVVVLKVGKGTAGKRAAASHTGSLAGSHAAAQAAFARAGVFEAADSDALFDALTLLSSTVPPPAGRRIAVMTSGGGVGVLASDAAERAGLELPTPSEPTVGRLRGLLPPIAGLTNPIDYTPACPPENYPAVFDAVLGDPAYEGLAVVNCGLDVPEFGEGLVAAQRRSGKPVAAFLLDVPKVERAATDAGIPSLPSPERAVEALSLSARPDRPHVSGTEVEP